MVGRLLVWMVLRSARKDASMHLNQAQRQHSEAWLQDRRVEHCPTCDRHDFSVGDVTAAPAMVHVICAHCAHVLLFDAMAIGVVPQR